MTPKTLRIGMSIVLVLAVVGGAAAGVAVADHDSENDNCGGLHTAEENTEDSQGNDRVSHNHDECHENEGND